MKNSTRYFLMLGLMGALGANLSWNPELFLISREDYKTMGLTQELQFASTDTAAPNATGEVDLSRYDRSMEGVKVDYTIIDRDGNKSVRYYLKGNVCSDCWKIQAPAISQDNFQNMELLQRALAEAAIAEVKKGRATPGADVAAADKDKDKNKEDKPKRRRAPEVTSECDEDETSDQIACEKDELQAIMDNCSSSVDDEETGSRRRKREERSTRREACVKKAHAYYKKFLQKSIKEGLSAGTNTDEYAAAIEARDSLLSEMPKKFDNTIKKDLVTTTAQGIVARARDRYNAVLNMSKDQTTAANAAKTFILNETYGATGQRLCASLSGENCMMALNNPMQRTMLESSNSNFRMFTENFETRLRQVATHQGTTLPFEAVINGEFDAGIPQLGATVPADLLAARTQGVRNNAQPVPGTGQGPVSLTHGLPAPSGQIWVPGHTAPANMGAVPGALSPPVPGQTMTASPFGTQPGVYNPMAPVGTPNGINGNFPLSPAQRQGRM